MKLNITAESRKIWQETLALLEGQARRLFMASVVSDLGRGGAAWAHRELGWDRTTVGKGLHELASGIVCVDSLQLRGRKGYAAKQPGLEADLKANLSRGGKSRNGHQALDHDLEPEAKLAPFGMRRPDTAETWLSFTTGHATADFMADRLSEIWPTLKKRSFSTYPRDQRRQRP